jgi:hypothetical protein
LLLIFNKINNIFIPKKSFEIMLKHKLTIAIIMLFIFQSLLMLNSVEAKSMTVANSSGSVNVNIDDAYYTDYSGDGIEDDVVVHFTFVINQGSRAHFEAYFTLTLPSGASFMYGYIINTRLSELEGTIVFYHHATEPGYYNIKIDLILRSGGVTHGSTDYDFDPPGQSPGGDPHAVLTFNF